MKEILKNLDLHGCHGISMFIHIFFEIVIQIFKNEI